MDVTRGDHEYVAEYEDGSTVLLSKDALACDSNLRNAILDSYKEATENQTGLRVQYSNLFEGDVHLIHKMAAEATPKKRRELPDCVRNPPRIKTPSPSPPPLVPDHVIVFSPQDGTLKRMGNAEWNEGHPPEEGDLVTVECDGKPEDWRVNKCINIYTAEFQGETIVHAEVIAHLA